MGRINRLILVFVLIILSGCSLNNEPNNIYQIAEFLDESLYNEYLQDDKTIFNNLISFEKKLMNSNEFEFYQYGNNFIEAINVDMPDTCIVNYGTIYENQSKYIIDDENILAIEAIQISNNFFDLFPIEIIYGRNFNKEDFNFKDCIPVILGSAYKEYFNINDKFEAYYLYDRKEFEVIGFIDDESKFYLGANNSYVKYSNFIVMPFNNIYEDNYSSRLILLQKINGFIIPKTNKFDSLNCINDYLKESNLEKWIGSIKIFENSINKK